VKYYRDTWKGNECQLDIFELLKICMRELERVLGCQEGIPMTSTLVQL